jgi:hypothetical protein
MRSMGKLLMALASVAAGGALAGGIAACGDGTSAGVGSGSSGGGSSSGSGSSGGSSGSVSTSSGAGSGGGSGSGGSSGSPTGSSSSSGSRNGVDGGGDAGPGDDGGDAAPSSGLVSARDLVCTQVIGVSITYDWFTNGFDMPPLDTARFQLKGVDVPMQSFIENWTDPNDPIWSSPVVAPCAASSDNPDRIIYVGVEWNFTTAAQWQTAYDGVVATFKSQYSNLRRVDLMTMLRAPNDVQCPNGVPTQVVQPFIDQAIQMEAQSNPTFVAAAPKFYAPDCSVFLPNSEHLQPTDYGVVAKVFQDYYANEPN